MSKSSHVGRIGGRRHAAVRVKGGKAHKPSSRQWLQRQLNDPYVHEAKRLGYRSRAAFKLLELDDKAKLLRPGLKVVDLGAAPGGWTQVAVARVKAGEGRGRVVAIDIQPIEPIPGATVLLGDMTDPATDQRLLDELGGLADLVLSDMSPATVGHAQTDHLRIVALVEAAAEFALRHLAAGGAFVAKVFEGGTEQELLLRLKRSFTTVRHIKPPASRKDSAEIYLVATGFRGAPAAA
ncbi:MAG: RlmE family RNA methyltransferase [Rhodospirillaceae bacterium]|nr:RlmE family RNA methyltransferase [Rhodospirillaceae bacterium]